MDVRGCVIILTTALYHRQLNDKRTSSSHIFILIPILYTSLVETSKRKENNGPFCKSFVNCKSFEMDFNSLKQRTYFNSFSSVNLSFSVAFV